MKRYLFGLHYSDGIYYHEERFECDADAMIRARAILGEGKRDVNAFLISLYVMNGCDWRNIVNYQ